MELHVYQACSRGLEKKIVYFIVWFSDYHENFLNIGTGVPEQIMQTQSQTAL